MTAQGWSAFKQMKLIKRETHVDKLGDVWVREWRTSRGITLKVIYQPHLTLPPGEEYVGVTTFDH